MTTTEQLQDTIAALEAQLAADNQDLRTLGEALEALPAGAKIPVSNDDLLEPLQTRSSLPAASPAMWLGLRG